MKASISSLLLSAAVLPSALGAVIPPAGQQDLPLVPGLLSTVGGILNGGKTPSAPQTETDPSVNIGLGKRQADDVLPPVDVDIDLGDILTKKSDPVDSDKVDTPGVSISTSDGEEGYRAEINVERQVVTQSEDPNGEGDVATINIGTEKDTRSELLERGTETQETEGKRCKPRPFVICKDR